MTAVRGVPPGRAGRTWLRRRLETSRRGADLLDRKLRILRREQARSAQRAEEASRRWASALVEAERWGRRAALLAGDAALDRPPGVAPAVAHVEWSSVMGTRFPSSAHVVRTAPERPLALALSSAVTCAAQAYGAALEAAVDAAAAAGALRVVDEEITVTTVRLRAIEQRWVPRLEAAGRGAGPGSWPRPRARRRCFGACRRRRWPR